MTKKEIADKYLCYLKTAGYVAEITPTTDVHFKKDEGSFLIIIDEKDETFLQIAFPSFFGITGEDDRAKANAACSKACSGSKAAKVFSMGNDVWATVEIFLPEPDNFHVVFGRCLSALIHGVQMFAIAYNEKDTPNKA